MRQHKSNRRQTAVYSVQLNKTSARARHAQVHQTIETSSCGVRLAVAHVPVCTCVYVHVCVCHIVSSSFSSSPPRLPLLHHHPDPKRLLHMHAPIRGRWSPCLALQLSVCALCAMGGWWREVPGSGMGERTRTSARNRRNRRERSTNNINEVQY